MKNGTICTFCGGTYEYKFGKWICSYCGQPKPEELGNAEQNLLDVAGQKLRLPDFEEAETLFADLVQKYPHNPDAYWGLVCAKYGIKYEEDFNGKRIPTCCMDTIPSFGDDANYKKALLYASAEQKKWYQEQAAYIQSVSKQWKEDASKEKPYDIFICFKDSDKANGIERTQDSVDATDMYLKLTEKGYRVFMSRVSLQDKTGEKYEPYIFQALQTAKVMIVFGSSVEYITSTWLQNEWKRYLKRMANGEKEKNSLVVAYKGFNPAQMPSVLSKKQCLDFAKNDFYQLLLEYLQNFFQRQSDTTPTQEKKQGFYGRLFGQKEEDSSTADERIESAPETKTKPSQQIPTYKRDGKYVYFGSYPQSQVTDIRIQTELNRLAGEVPITTKSLLKKLFSKSRKWKSYKYYINGSNDTDFMWYQDIEYNGEKYRGVYFTSYRPHLIFEDSSADNTYQDDNGYTTSTIYWFQYEPIKWRILEEEDCYVTILAELILDSQAYQNEYEYKNYDDYINGNYIKGYYIKGTNTYANNYAESTIRKWLNETFYNTAFTTLQQALIQTVTVDNSANSTTDTGNNIKKARKYACSNTNDKVWLLSEYEVTKSDWDFARYNTCDTARQKTTSDYARCQGAWTSTSTDSNGKGDWWLRSPFSHDSGCARHIYGVGDADSYSYIFDASDGVVPALKIKLS